ncbi:hypothetical protein HYV31_03310 [candidate division WWE3 bacterium]|nr:hypothetical protein [candidate division WWE3 bacterium]
MKSLSDLLKFKDIKSNTRNKYEFQAYGNRLAEEFGDISHRALYIKLAKLENRDLLEQARDFVLNQENATTKGKLFMWKLKELKNSKIIKVQQNKNQKDSLPQVVEDRQ